MPRRLKAPDAAGVIIQRRDRCVTAILGHPRISAAVARKLIELIEEIEDDDAILMLAITSAGSTFCTGFDREVDPNLVETIAALAKPTLAIINGDAFDEGLELALALDLRIAAGSARFAITQPRRGLMPHFGGTQRLPRIVGAPAALTMLLTGEPINAREAVRLGLVTRSARTAAEFRRLADRTKKEILSRGPLSALMVKEAVLKGYDMTLAQGIRLEEDLYALLQTTADRSAGIDAFLNKRKPLFKGV